MMFMVLIAGIGLLVAGLATVGVGIELDLSLGNTLLLAGTIVACTGALLLGLWTAIRELKAAVRQQLSSGLPEASRAASLGVALGDQAPEDSGFPFSRDQPEGAGHAEPPIPIPAPPWLEEAASRGRGEAPGPVPDEASPAAKPRRNLMFSSTSRKERERRLQSRMAEASGADPAPASPGFASAPEAADPHPAPTFDDAWPMSERLHPPDAPLPRRSRMPSTFADTAPGEDQSQVTVLKSGVVDGMAYSLYSDGSIEAQMPEGMMRFASIDELRAHLDQRP
jgi:hypothetical protein